MNFKIYGLILIAILAIGSVNAVNATFNLRFSSDGSSHLFTTDVTGSDGLKWHSRDDVPGAINKEVPMHLGQTYHFTVNSKVWRMNGFFTFGWEKTGTTKSYDFTYRNPNQYVIVGTYGDTLFNGGHLTIETDEW